MPERSSSAAAVGRCHILHRPADDYRSFAAVEDGGAGKPDD